MLTDAHMTRWMEVLITGQIDTNFENNLAQVVSYNPGFKSIGVSVFKLESRKHNMDGCEHTQNGHMGGHQFQPQPCSVGVLSSY